LLTAVRFFACCWTFNYRKIATDGIEKVLKDKTQVEKVNLKSKELAKVKLGKFKKDNLDIEIIGDIKEIDGGIQIFAKSLEKTEKQLGLVKMEQ